MILVCNRWPGNDPTAAKIWPCLCYLLYCVVSVPFCADEPVYPRGAARPTGTLHHALCASVLNAWVIALRSSNVTLKEIAARAIAGILREAIDDVAVLSGAYQSHNYYHI